MRFIATLVFVAGLGVAGFGQAVAQLPDGRYSDGIISITMRDEGRSGSMGLSPVGWTEDLQLEWNFFWYEIKAWRQEISGNLNEEEPVYSLVTIGYMNVSLIDPFSYRLDISWLDGSGGSTIVTML